MGLCDCSKSQEKESKLMWHLIRESYLEDCKETFNSMRHLAKPGIF